MTRVVITGMGAYSPLGKDVSNIVSRLKNTQNAISVVESLKEYKGFNTCLGGVVTEELPNYPRKKSRTMGRIGKLAVAATEDALRDANLLDSEDLTNGSTGIAYGSSGGSFEAMEQVANFCGDKDISYLNATTYVLMMPHTVAVNISIFFGVHGRIIVTSSACTSGSQGIGYGYEAIKSGAQKIMICGGAEELNNLTVGVFDSMFAASTKNDTPELTPTPFDKNRDGIVVAEGAGTLILEEYEHAKARNAHIYAEVVGFATNCDATHVTNPSSKDMEQCMRLALDNAGLKPSDIGYINAHGTGTTNGDLAESVATEGVFGSETPISTLKSYMGHTLGAAGALEAIYSIKMQAANWFSPNLNLTTLDENCGKLNYITGEGITKDCQYIMSNNFAFGGVNTSLIFKKFVE